MSGVDKFRKYLESSEGVQVSGSGEVTVGKAVVKISGSGRYVEGEILKVSGAAKVDGDVKVRMMSVSGSFKSNGSINAETVKIAGAAKILGSLKARVLSVAGALKISGDLDVETAKIAGAAKLGCGKFDLLKIDGALRAETIEASKFILGLEGFSQVKTIKADFVEVKRVRKPFVKVGPFEISFNKGLNLRVSIHEKGVKLEAGKIKALKAELESVTCEELYAGIAVIGDECHIKRLYYSESYEVSDKARVDEVVKVKDISNA